MEKREFTPKTRSWSDNDYATILRETRLSINKVMEGGDNAVIWGDFNVKRYCCHYWEEMSAEGENNLWENVLLDMTMERNTTTQ